MASLIHEHDYVDELAISSLSTYVQVIIVNLNIKSQSDFLVTDKLEWWIIGWRLVTFSLSKTNKEVAENRFVCLFIFYPFRTHDSIFTF